MKAVLLIPSLLALVRTAHGILVCRPDGPVVPAPRNLSNSAILKRVSADLTAALDKAVKGEIKAGWPVENVSFSLGLVSLGQKDPGIPIWEYHHLSPKNVNGTKKADRDSQYLIGSVTKVLSDAIVLKSGIELDDPITKWLPQLNNASSLISWNNITIRALASHLAGIPPNYGFSEYYFIKDFFEKLGFPHVEDKDYNSCGITGLNSGCNKQQLLEGLSDVYPIAPPNGRPVYSNIAFNLLAYAVEAATGKNYTVQLQDYLASPLGLTGTTPSPGINERAVIPPGESTWGSDYGDFAPGGGLVSTLRDLSIFTHAILDQSIFSSPTAVREWLQPRAFAGSPYSFVGTPWEIYQPPIEGEQTLTSEHPHTITIFGKGGAAYGYNSQIAVIPQYGVSLVLLTAGDQSALFFLYDALLSALMPAIDEAARDEAKANGFAGSFASETTNATFRIDNDSLVLASLSRNGSDILEAFSTIWSVTLGSIMPPFDNSSLRLFPTDLPPVADKLLDGRVVLLEDWRLWWSVALSSETDLPQKQLMAKDCLLWAFADWLYYASEPIDRVVFVRDAATGEVLGVEVPFLRSGFLARGG